MAVILPFAFLSGLVTILSPCILPVLPVVLSGSVGGKSRPYGVITGFVLSFSVFTLALSSLVQALNIPPDALRIAAVVLILIFGLVMLVPRLRNGFEMIASRLARIGSARSGGTRRESKGYAGGLLIGASLGLVWTPCVGPIMASVISLAVTQAVDGGAVFIILVYSLGTAIPMLAIMLGGRTLLNRVPSLSRKLPRIQQVFGVLMVMVAVTIAFGWDRRFQAAVLRIFPNYGSGLTAFESAAPVRDALEARSDALESDGGDGSPAFGGQTGEARSSGVQTRPARLEIEASTADGIIGDYGLAPDIVTTGEWFNIEALGDAGAVGSAEGAAVTMDELKGKVVLIDFWTYSCVNCVRTIPHLKAWYDTYRDDGFVIIGVHTPEFAFERKPENVRQAMYELGVDWPVVLDNDYAQWHAFKNRFWPAHYFIDAAGKVRYFHYGEGKYDMSENVIRKLLAEADSLSSEKAAARPEAKLESKTAETYLGYARARGFASAVNPKPDEPVLYSPARIPANGEWTLDGTWTITSEYVVPEEKGVLELGFYAKDVFLVIEAADPDGRIHVRVDGVPVENTIDVREGVLLAEESRLYHLVKKPEPGEHVLRLEVDGKLKLFAFTFG